jgi:hypothetical protein
METINDLIRLKQLCNEAFALADKLEQSQREPVPPPEKVYRAGQWFRGTVDNSVYYSLVEFTDRGYLYLVEYPAGTVKDVYSGTCVTETELYNGCSIKPIDMFLG